MCNGDEESIENEERTKVEKLNLYERAIAKMFEEDSACQSLLCISLDLISMVILLMLLILYLHASRFLLLLAY